MPVLENPTNFVSGSTRLTGDVQIDGKIDLGGNLDIDEVVIGDGASISDSGNVAVGLDATANNKNTTALGQNATASGQDATALGKETTAPANWNTVVGYDAGSNLNGNNVVLVGRKAEAQGDNGTAVGEIATANGANSSAFGRDTRATADDASAFGHSSSASGVGATVMGQSGTADQDNATALGSSTSATGLRALAAGEGATASSNDATALGRNATASASDAIALGSGTTVSTSNTYGVGSRDIKIETGNKLIYPQDSGSQTLVNMPVSANPTAGTQQSYSLEVNSETILEINAEADGSGGIQNASADVPVDLNVTGNTTEVDNVITGDILLEDTTPTTQFRFDATVSPPLIELNGNDIRQLGATPAASTGALRLGNSTSILARNNADNNDFGIDFNSSDEVAINSAKLRLSSNLIANNGEVIWDETATEIPDSAMGTIAATTLNLGNGVEDNSGSLRLNPGAVAGDGLKETSPNTLAVEPADFAGTYLSDDGSDNLTVNISSGLENTGTGSIQTSGGSIADGFLSEGSSAHQVSVNLGNGLEGNGTNGIRVSGGAVAGNVLSEGSNPYQVDVNIGNGLEENTGSLRVNPQNIAGDGLKETSSTTLGVEPADFAGTFLSDSNDDLTVDIGSGLENNGTGSIRVDEDTAFNFTSTIDFNNGLNINGDGDKIFLGANDDVSIRYDANADSIVIRDETGGTDIMGIDRTSGNVNITGTLTENTTV